MTEAEGQKWNELEAEVERLREELADARTMAYGPNRTFLEERSALKAEVERLEAQTRRQGDRIDAAEAEVERLRGVVEAARKRVGGSHAMGCSAYQSDKPCDCGRDELRAALAELEAKP